MNDARIVERMKSSTQAQAPGPVSARLEKSVSLSRDLIAGGISGCVTRVLVAPLDVIKIRFQVRGDGMLDS